MASSTHLIVGLGNPGTEYACSRHNVGWLVLDNFLGRIGAGKPKGKFEASFWESESMGGHRVSLMKPLTYMNRSGIAVREAVRYFDILPQSVLVIYDDVALPVGRARLRMKGSAGGQKGMISVLGALGTFDVPRMRIGVGQSEVPSLASWVLGAMNKADIAAVYSLMDTCYESACMWLDGNTDGAMNRLNGVSLP